MLPDVAAIGGAGPSVGAVLRARLDARAIRAETATVNRRAVRHRANVQVGRDERLRTRRQAARVHVRDGTALVKLGKQKSATLRQTQALIARLCVHNTVRLLAGNDALVQTRLV